MPDNQAANEVAEAHGDGHHAQGSVAALTIGAAGVVFGDIGTSPLYAMKEVFVGHHPLAVDPLHLFGVISLMFWSLMIIVTFKYVTVILRADNKGEGGSLALLALIQRSTGGGKWSKGLVLLGIAATALFFGDAMITPAVSVLSAVEGLSTVSDSFTPYVIPAAIAILVGLFAIQRHGTDTVGKLFGPVMLLYFAVIATLGVVQIAQNPAVLQGLNPIWAYRFFADNPMSAFLAMGSVVLAVTGAEALYADMGHFGKNPIRIAWLFLVFPALLLNYLGQAALMLRLPETAANPFYLMAGESWRLPMVILATLATIIASQAVITGAFSVVRQAVQLGLMPRIHIDHTSEKAAGQIYIPAVNWVLMMLVILLVLGFRESTNLAAAYGIAVTGTMFITAIMLAVLQRRVWKWPLWAVAIEIGLFVLIDGLFFASNLTKLFDGGWFPLLIGAIAFTLLTTWATGRKLVINRLNEGSMPINVFIKSACTSAHRVPLTAVYMTSARDGVPPALLHNLKHNMVLHERNVLLTVKIGDVPRVPEEKRVELHDMGSGFYRVILHYGFMEEADVPAALASVQQPEKFYQPMKTSFFLSRQTLLVSSRPGMAIWREKLFAWMLRNAESAMEFFKLPTNRVVELGSQVEI
ncbi:potassium transporter Kup [Sphingomonas jaspsi]|uniref:potassium transporter Kup n=1 Tax=Sphingomonas jaspsi TaxID=392409 RepID=UPI0004B6F594|nr:potassium transporter Kup [Sphingomonas jaspsi]